MSFINTVAIAPIVYDRLLAVFDQFYIVKLGSDIRDCPLRMVGKNNVLARLLHFYTAEVEAKTFSSQGIEAITRGMPDSKYYSSQIPTDSDEQSSYYNGKINN
ncbi:hypothetical protein PF005_g11978 [Phytophthora fragariae]|uniref:Uncharacterized protein n=1 Tax=Phytophthora fragariae TaxID=53985 RepID=A0A6A3Y0N1_9STRA|nr:hypothetical protein PF005_g11978 [Phytophthora fragariae]